MKGSRNAEAAWNAEASAARNGKGEGKRTTAGRSTFATTAHEPWSEYPGIQHRGTDPEDWKDYLSNERPSLWKGSGGSWESDAGSRAGQSPERDMKARPAAPSSYGGSYVPAASTSGVIMPGGREVDLFNDDHVFAEIRRDWGIPDGFLNSGWSWQMLEPGRGKKESEMVHIKGKYVIKEITYGEHRCLRSIGYSFLQHMRSGSTLLCPIFLHYRDLETGRLFIAMPSVTGMGPFKAMYDLKGCDDDKTLHYNGEWLQQVHKRFWKLLMWGGTCCWNYDRFMYHKGKKAARRVYIPIAKDRRRQVLDAMKRDTDWLCRENLMDYSLLVTMQEGSVYDESSKAEGGPFTFLDGSSDDMVTSVTIIDFLTEWGALQSLKGLFTLTDKKKALVRPEEYADRFCEHFSKRLATPQVGKFGREQREALERTQKSFMRDRDDDPEVRSALSASNISITPAGRPVVLYNDLIFRQLRKDCGVPDDFLNGTDWELPGVDDWWQFRWNEENMAPGGGKNGNMVINVHGKYMVKELSRTTHKCLQRITSGYSDHVNRGTSLLATILLHFRDETTFRLFCAMRNELGPGPFKSVYDLKGCEDDRILVDRGRKIRPVYKRYFRPIMWCGQCLWSSDRVKYYEGKLDARELEIPIPKEQRRRLLEAIRRDTDWLRKNKLLNYSMLVGVSKATAGLEGRTDDGDRPLIKVYSPGEDAVTSLRIIDFFQEWTNSTVAANVAKICEANKGTIRPDRYADRFVEYFTKRFTVGEGAPRQNTRTLDTPPKYLCWWFLGCFWCGEVCGSRSRRKSWRDSTLVRNLPCRCFVAKQDQVVRRGRDEDDDGGCCSCFGSSRRRRYRGEVSRDSPRGSDNEWAGDDFYRGVSCSSAEY